MERRKTEGLSFAVTLILVTLGFFWIILPYYGAVLWAVILAILFHPLYLLLLGRTGNRRNLAAALSLAACICIVVIPGALLLAALAREATWLYNNLSSSSYDIPAGLRGLQDLLPDFVVEALALLGLDDLAEIQQRINAVLGQVAQAVAAQALVIGQSTAQFFVALGVMLYVLFFFFRDGTAIAAAIRRASPLNDHHTMRIFQKFSSAVKATVKGNLTIALIQGGIGGLTFWLLGVKGALLWAAAMTVLSLLPAVGAGLIWAPVAIYLLLTGQILRGLVLIAVGVLIISIIDNLLRPTLVGKDLRLPDYLILLSTLGGLALFGINGFVIGPLIAALFASVWLLFAEEQKGANA